MFANPYTLTFILVFCSCSHHHGLAAILFRQCTHENDLGTAPSRGHIFNSCIRNHHFQHEDHAWVLTLSTIQQTTFTGCTFRHHDHNNVTHSLANTSWVDVMFINSVFRGRQVTFSNTYMRNVSFVNCSFTANVDVNLLSFDVKFITFTHCNFAGRLIWYGGVAQFVKFDRCVFGARHTRDVRKELVRHRGDMNLSHVSVYGMSFNDCRGDVNVIYISSAVVKELKFQKSFIGSLRCVPNGDRSSVHVQLQMTYFFNTTFTDSFSCTGGNISALFLRDVIVHNVFNLSAASIHMLVVRRLEGVSYQKSTFDLSKALLTEKHATVELLNITAMKLSWVEARVHSRVRSIGWDWIDDHVDLHNTVFVTAVVGKYCCSELCANVSLDNDNDTEGNGRGCICDLSEEESRRTHCPPVNGMVRRQGSDGGGPACFPADSIVYVSETRRIRMDHLDYGTDLRVRMNGNYINSHSSEKHYKFGTVYFFGHKTSTSSSLSHINNVLTYQFISLTAYAFVSGRNFTIYLSGDHLIPVQHRGTIAARYVRVSDCVYTIDGVANVTIISTAWKTGLYAPVTTSGRMVVDGFLVSCFVGFLREPVTQALLLPVRMFVLVPAVGYDAFRLKAHVHRMRSKLMTTASNAFQRVIDENAGLTKYAIGT